MFDMLLHVQIIHESTLGCAIKLELTPNSLLTTGLALIDNIVQHLRSTGPSNLIGSGTVVEETIEEREGQ